MLHLIISENQGGFVPNKQIIDNVIIIQEVVHSSILKQEKGMIIKLDMANAFDRVSLTSYTSEIWVLKRNNRSDTRMHIHSLDSPPHHWKTQ